MISSSRILGTVLIFVAQYSMAAGYGIYDARSMAMGGAGVAVGSTDHGFFYNPSLLAFHETREDKSLDGRFYLPMIVGQVTDSAEDAIDLVGDDLDIALGRALDVYNNDPTIDNASSAFTIARDLEQSLEGLINKEIITDAYAGVAVAEPGVLGGGAFFVGARVIGGGVANVPPEDEALFEDYSEALQFIATEGSAGSAHPELFDVDGSFLDPYATITSTLTARGAVIMETGLAVAKQFRWRNIHFTAGATPKLMRLRTFDETREINDVSLNVNSNIESHLAINMDLGFAAQIGNHFRVGLASKDIMKQSFDTELGNTISLVPRSRLGLAYIHPWVSLGIDVDLEKSTPFVQEAVRQDISVGAEVDVLGYAKLRLGYRSDLESNYANTTSFGVGLQWKRWLMDIAMINSAGELGGGLQFGLAF